MNFPSKLIEEAVNEVSRLPGIGKKTALRLVLHLLKKDNSVTFGLTQALEKARTQCKYCQDCHSLADADTCDICANPRRDHTTLCVVEDIRDLIAIENTHQYHGLYHVLGGVISPLERISPDQLTIDSLLDRVKRTGVQEVILALSTTMEGDTTSFYITRKIKEFNVRVTSIARGIPLGGELEYADEITLGRSIATRTLFQI